MTFSKQVIFSLAVLALLQVCIADTEPVTTRRALTRRKTRAHIIASNTRVLQSKSSKSSKSPKASNSSKEPKMSSNSEKSSKSSKSSKDSVMTSVSALEASSSGFQKENVVGASIVAAAAMTLLL